MYYYKLYIINMLLQDVTMGMLYNVGVGDNSAADWWSLEQFPIKPDLQDICAMEANFTAYTSWGMSPVSACVPGTQEISWLDQKAICLLNANVFICPFSLPLCEPRLHIWSYHDSLWEKRNPLFSMEMEEKESDGAGVLCSSSSRADAANPLMKQVGNLLLGYWSGTASFHLPFQGCRHIGSL